MKGVVFNLLEGFITDGWGEDAYERILAACPIHSGPFVGPGTYPDAELLAIVDEAVKALGVTTPQALHAFGKYAFPRLARRFPLFLEGHTHPKTFLQTIDSVIHVEVRKLYKDAETPRILVLDAAPGTDRLVLGYESRRQLCPFMTGLVEGAGEFFATPLRWTETRCTRDGARACEIAITFAAAGEAPEARP